MALSTFTFYSPVRDSFFKRTCKVMRFFRSIAFGVALLDFGLTARAGVEEKVFAGMDEATVTVQSERPKLRADTQNGVILSLDFQTHAILSLADVVAGIATEPRNVTLSFKQPGSILYPGYNGATQELEVFWRGHESPLLKTKAPRGDGVVRVALRQRDQLALFVIPEKGDAVLVSLARVDYVITLRNAAQYELCKELKIALGEKRALSLDELKRGVKLDCLDEAADITVNGRDPMGEPFAHRYTFDFETLNKKLDDAYRQLSRNAHRSGAAPVSGTPPPVGDAEK
jgi:hypothetical protein